MGFSPAKTKYIKQLSRLKLSEQKSILGGDAPDQLINELHFLIKHLVNNKSVVDKLNKKQITKIRKFKTFLRKIANSRGKTQTVRKKIVKGLRGGFLPALLPLLPVIASTIASIVNNV